MNTAPRALGVLALAALLASPAMAAEKPVGYKPHVLTAADAAAVNAYLLSDYSPNHVAAGAVVGVDAEYGLIVIPVTAPLYDVAGRPAGSTPMEILVPR